MTLLTDKIAAMDEPIHLPSFAVSPSAPPRGEASLTFPLLEAAAVARNITMTEAAGLIIGKAAECDTVLWESERFREQMARAIESARDDLTMLSLREWLLNDIYPALTERFKAPLDNTRPIAPDAPLNASALIHERARLKVQLREKINLKRASLNSDYVQNDAMLKHKARLAQLVLLSADGEAPPERGHLRAPHLCRSARPDVTQGG